MPKLTVCMLCLCIIMLINIEKAAAANNVLTACSSLNANEPALSFWYGFDPPIGKPLNPIVVPLDDFIIGVVEGEIFPGAGSDPDGIAAFTIENMKAQAVIARSFAFSNCHNQPAGPFGNFDGFTLNQIAYWPRREGANYEPLIGDFVRNNSYYIANSNRLTNAVDAQFKDFTHSPATLYTAADPTSPNLIAVYDALCANI